MSFSVYQAQFQLYKLGYWTGIPDNKFESTTKIAVVAFQFVNNLPTTGELDEATEALLFSEKALAKPISDFRKEATKKEVAKFVPSINAALNVEFLTRFLKVVSAIATLLLAMASAFPAAQAIVQPIVSTFSRYIPEWGYPAALLFIVTLLGLQNTRVIKEQLSDFRDGMLNGHPSNDCPPELNEKGD